MKFLPITFLYAFIVLGCGKKAENDKNRSPEQPPDDNKSIHWELVDEKTLGPPQKLWAPKLPRG